MQISHKKRSLRSQKRRVTFVIRKDLLHREDKMRSLNVEIHGNKKYPDILSEHKLSAIFELYTNIGGDVEEWRVFDEDRKLD